jgi:hypothetical protein
MAIMKERRMKKETKDLVRWIKEALEEWANITRCREGNRDYFKALKFLDSLPEIESHLCNGGYIQDKNGTPCCNGDRIMQKVIGKDEIGFLYWSKNDSRFYFKNKQYIAALSCYFTKL